MKKLMILLLCLALVLSMTACGGGKDDALDEAAEAPAAEPTEASADPTAEPTAEPTEEPEPTAEPTADPTEEPITDDAAAAGTVSGGVYTNTVFGISFAPPAGWSLMSQEELANLQEVSGDALSQQSEDMGEAYEAVLESGSVQYVMSASSPEGFDNVAAMVEHIPGMGGLVDVDTLLDLATGQMGLGNEDLSDLGIVTERNTISLGGTEYPGVAMTQDGAAYGLNVDICQQLVIMLEGDYALQLVFTTTTGREAIDQMASYFSPVQ